MEPPDIKGFLTYERQRVRETGHQVWAFVWAELATSAILSLAGILTAHPWHQPHHRSELHRVLTWIVVTLGPFGAVFIVVVVAHWIATPFRFLKAERKKRVAFETELAAVRAAQRAPKRLPPEHVEEMKEMIRAARREVAARLNIFFGANGLSEGDLYSDAIKVHFPVLYLQLLEWDVLLQKWTHRQEDLEVRLRRETDALPPIAVTDDRASTLLKAMTATRPAQPSDWGDGFHTPKTLVFPWRGQYVLELPRGTSPKNVAVAKAEWEHLVQEARSWPERMDCSVLHAEVSLASLKLDDPLAHAEKQHLINDTHFCKMCPEEYRVAVENATS